MPIILVFILLLTGSSFASTDSHCHQVDGIYKNSKASLDELKFESLVDYFSFNNAKNFTIRIDGEKMKFHRTSIDVRRTTQMKFQRHGKSSTAVVQMDRTPQSALKTKAFYGNILIEFTESSYVTYNFFCTF